MFNEVRQIFFLLERSDRLKVLWITLVQMLLSTFDLIGIALIGVIGALSVTGVASQNPESNTSKILMIFQMENLSFQNQVAVLTCIATLFLIGKTLLSVLLTRRSLYFLSAKSSQVASILIEKILSQSVFYFQRFTTQRLIHSVNVGVNSLYLSVIGVSTLVIADIALLAVLALGLFVLSPIIAAVSLTFLFLVSVTLFVLMHKRADKIGLMDAKLSIEANEKMIEVLSSYREMKIRNRESFYSSNLKTTHSALTEVLAERTFMPSISKYVIEVSVIVGAVGICAVQFLFLNASNAVATMAIFMASGLRIAPAVLRIQQGLLQIRTSMGVGNDALELIKELENVPRLGTSTSVFNCNHADFTPRVKFSNVYAIYPNSSEFALSGINFEFEPGESVAIVGPSGSGKSSLLDVLLGMIPIAQGSVTISGSSVDYVYKNFPGAIGFVPQDVFLVNKSIRENIALGFDLREINQHALEFAIDRSSLSELVNTFDDGLNSSVGERGNLLSGGERQRIGIARALVTLPRLLVLDEATSSLDGISEDKIIKALLSLRGQCTIIMVAHRLSTVLNFDRIVYLDGGMIRAVGTFEEVRRSVPAFDKQAKLMGL